MTCGTKLLQVGLPLEWLQLGSLRRSVEVLLTATNASMGGSKLTCVVFLHFLMIIYR
jgi:hypothetical protein